MVQRDGAFMVQRDSCHFASSRSAWWTLSSAARRVELVGGDVARLDQFLGILETLARILEAGLGCLHGCLGSFTGDDIGAAVEACEQVSLVNLVPGSACHLFHLACDLGADEAVVETHHGCRCFTCGMEKQRLQWHHGDRSALLRGIGATCRCPQKQQECEQEGGRGQGARKRPGCMVFPGVVSCTAAEKRRRYEGVRGHIHVKVASKTGWKPL